MVRLVKVVFRYGMGPEEIEWVTMVLLPKGKGGYRGTGIVDLLSKVCSVVVNCLLKRSVVLHDALHGFRKWRGTRTATLDAKLSQHLTGLSYKPLFHIFLDVRKAYE